MSSPKKENLDASALEILLAKLNQLETGQNSLVRNIQLLNEENSKRADEIKILARKSDSLLTEDENASGGGLPSGPSASHSDDEEGDNGLGSDNFGPLPPTRGSRTAVGPQQKFGVPPAMQTQRTVVAGQQILSATLIPAKDVIRTIEVLNGRDDIGVQDFVRSVKRARMRCSQPDLLLDFVIAEKIVDQAKRSIRHASIGSYDDLFDALETNLAPTSSIELCRSRLENCYQNNDTVQNYNMRFRQLLNELNYAIQAEHHQPCERSIALKIEERTAIKRYIMNLRDEICIQVRPLQPKTFAKALQAALEAEAWYRERVRNRAFSTTKPVSRPSNPMQRSPSTFHHRYQSSYENPPNHGVPLQQRIQMTCYNCKKLGHVQSQCPVLKTSQGFRQGQFSNRPPQRVNTVADEEGANPATHGNQVEENLSSEYPQYPEEDYNQQSFEETDWETPDYWSTQDHQ